MIEHNENFSPGQDSATGENALPTETVESEPSPVAMEADRIKRRRLLLLLPLLLTLLACTAIVFVRYLLQPAPLPDLLPVPVGVKYRPHYLFSIYGVDDPVGVALSPESDRVYVAESSGARLIRIFDTDGNQLNTFSPPRTQPSQRSPVYLATDSRGRVFVTDRLQHAIFVFDRDGNYQDTILGPDLTLTEYLSQQVKGFDADAQFAYNRFESEVRYQRQGEEERFLAVPQTVDWSPLGLRIDRADQAFLTEVTTNLHTVRIVPRAVIRARSWRDFDLSGTIFGEAGPGNNQLLFPNSAVADSQGRIYVADANNGRISVWDRRGNSLFTFGQGIGEGSLNLPRGVDIDGRDRLHVVDAVGQSVKVYDVSGSEPNYLFAFGNWGLGNGQFNYPNDIVLDPSGWLYIADRESNRVQVWSY